MATCKDCVHIEVCAFCSHDLPVCDSYMEVVRCKDCKHWERNVGVVDSPNGYCFRNDDVMNGFGFCSYGEREDDGTV